MDYKELKRKLEKRSDYREAKERNRLSSEIARMVMDARLKKGITQEELANLIGTKQPSIARIEHGEILPNLSYLEKIAKALGTKLIAPKFEMFNKKVQTKSDSQTSAREVIVVNTFYPHPATWRYGGQTVDRQLTWQKNNNN